MGITLPKDAKDVTTSSTPNPEAVKVAEENEKSLWESIAELPGGIYAQFTGEGIPIEFPNIPEVGEISDAPDFLDRIIPNLKEMMVRDDLGKSEVMEDSFSDDERWGGRFVDKFDNPMIVWSGKPYYVNKPGASTQDFATAVGEVIKYLPASKFVDKAKTLRSVIQRGLAAYPATEVASEVAEAAMTPEATAARDREAGDVLTDIGTATALGVATDVALPPIAKAIKKGASATSKKVAKLLPRFKPTADAIPLDQSAEAAKLFLGEKATRLDDMRQVFPDIYGNDAANIHGRGTVADEESVRAIQNAMGDPEAEVTIYKAVSPGVDEIRTGDPVTLSIRQADESASNPLLKSMGKPGKVISKKVKVRELYSAGDDLNELTFSPIPAKKETLAAGDSTQTSRFPLTKGQRSAPLPDRKAGLTPKATAQLEQEEALRRATGGREDASNIITGFDQFQLDQIRAEAEMLRKEFGSGDVSVTGAPDIPTAAAETIQTKVAREADNLKKLASEAYKVVKGADLPPAMTRLGIVETSQKALDSILKQGSEGGLGITQRELGDFPTLKREIDYLKRLNKLAKKPRFKAQPLSTLHGYQKTLSRAVRNAESGSPEQLALSRIKEVVDNAVFEGIETGIMVGDEKVLKELKEATGLYRDYMGLTGKGTGKNAQEKSANKILEQITNPDYTPKQVVNSFFGHAKFNPNQSMGLVLKKLRKILPPEEYLEVVALAKDAVLEKAFSGAGKSGITRTNIVNNFDDVFVKQKAITRLLFSPEEIAEIEMFKNDVLPTLWAEIKLNPSNSGYTVLAGLSRSGLMNYAKAVPIIGKDIVEGVQSASSTNEALEATRQFLARTNMPMFSSAVAAAARPPLLEDERESSPSLQSIIDSAPDSVIEKLNR